MDIPNRYAVCRQSGNAVLGMVGSDYTSLQNRETIAWFQPFLDTHDATLKTAGNLKGEAQVWVLA